MDYNMQDNQYKFAYFPYIKSKFKKIHPNFDSTDFFINQNRFYKNLKSPKQWKLGVSFSCWGLPTIIY